VPQREFAVVGRGQADIGHHVIHTQLQPSFLDSLTTSRVGILSIYDVASNISAVPSGWVPAGVAVRWHRLGRHLRCADAYATVLDGRASE
jgi:hypothetical protein